MNILKVAATFLLSIASLSIAEISQSREQHKIEFSPSNNGHGAVCDSWIIKNNTKIKGDIFNWDYKGNVLSSQSP